MTLVHNGMSMALERNRHPGEDELERYALGEIGEEGSASLEEHLLLCEACRERLRAHDSYVRAMKEAAAEWRAGHPAEGHRRPFIRRITKTLWGKF